MRYKAYRPSGKFTAAGTLLMALGGFFGTFLIETLYVYLLGFLSHLLLRFVIIVSCLVLISVYLMHLVQWSRTRNRRVVKIVMLIVLILAYYASRCVYVCLVNDMWELGANELLTKGSPFGELLLRWMKLFISPHVVFSALYKILPYGVSSLNGQMIAGIPLLLIWLIELLLFTSIPYLAVVELSSRPYDEVSGLWLTKRKEIPVVYIENYREIRSQLKLKNSEPLLEAIQNAVYYSREGQESYAILEFYMSKHHVGPYVSLTNVKAVQSGPKKLKHKFIPLCRLCEIGDEEARKLYEQLKAAKESDGRKPDLSRSIRDLIARMGWSQGKSVKSSKGAGAAPAAPEKALDEALLPAEENNTMKPEQEALLDLEVEGDTVHVPKVTPEMEKAYLNKKNS